MILGMISIEINYKSYFIETNHFEYDAVCSKILQSVLKTRSVEMLYMNIEAYIEPILDNPGKDNIRKD
ncbi:hypothetical protein DSECCO2_61960 [anaerobic digester metagenome]|jgi:hypothetical protein